MSKRLNTLGAGLVAILVSGGANASLIEWDMSGALGTEASRPVFSSATNVTGSSLVRGAGLTGNAGANSLNAIGWNNQATDYFGFGFTVADGYTVSLSDLQILTRSSATGPGAMGLYYSTDAFATSSLAYTFNQAPGGNNVFSAVGLGSLNNLTGTVEFRIQQIGTNSANGTATTGATGTFRVGDYSADNGTTYGNMVLNGSVAPVATVPVPAALWLMGSGLGFLGVLGRRRAA